MSSPSAVLKGCKVKTVADLIDKTVASLSKMSSSTKPKELEECSKYLDGLKKLLYGIGQVESVTTTLTGEIAKKAESSNFFPLLVEKLEFCEFEAKKDGVQIFTKLVRREVGQEPMARHPTVEYICKEPKILETLVKGYEDSHNQVDALNSGMMLRECVKMEPLAKVIVNDASLFDLFFVYVQKPTFDIAADAFSTFKELLTAHKITCAEFLEKSYDNVFSKYKDLLNSENYVTRRQSLKLLGELLLDRANFTIMTKYISDPENLKIMMNMLRDQSKNIQFEAFHVFKVFVANPNKSKPIMDILLRNQSKLVGFLEKFHESRAEDEQFADEKSYLIKQIKELK